jgi:hypothetical protein
MGTPPRDASGNVLPHDDPDIEDGDGLLRYIDPDNHLVWDDNLGRYRVSSAAFSESSTPNGGMSVDIEQSMVAAGLAREARLPNPRWGIARLLAGNMRQLGLQVGSDSLPENPHHGAVWGIGRNRRLRKVICGQAEYLRNATRR